MLSICIFINFSTPTIAALSFYEMDVYSKRDMLKNEDAVPLYSHDVRPFMLIVPAMHTSKLSAFLFRSPLIRIWATAIVIFTIVRIIQRKLTNPKESANRLVYIPFNTFGLSFGCTSVTGAKGRSEQITTFFLTVFGILASLLFPGNII